MNNLDQISYQLELAAYDEKISLAELEEAKAVQRTKELKYERTRFIMQWLELIAKAAEQSAKAQYEGPASQANDTAVRTPPPDADLSGLGPPNFAVRQPPTVRVPPSVPVEINSSDSVD